MATYTEVLTQNLKANDPNENGPVKIKTILTQNTFLHPSHVPVYAYVKALTQNMTCHQSDAEAWKWGRTITQAVKIGLAQGQLMTYHASHTDVIKLAQQLQRAYPVTLTQNMTAHQAAIFALHTTILQKLNLIPVHTPQVHYHVALAQAMLAHDALARVVAALLTQNMTVHPTLVKQYVANPVLTQALTIAAGMTNTLVLQIISNLDIHPMHIPRMIYNGQLLDVVNLTGLYISPNGTVTTWTINTRTNAVTEYTNYNFNSFAQRGLRYLATNSSGIYELDGDTDNGTSINADVISAFMQMNGSKLSGLKGIYLAIRGGGQYFVKIINGDGREYIYEAFGQPGLMTTKVSVGKGLRARYIAFELMSTGQDFDLDTLEFVPMLSDRRV